MPARARGPELTKAKAILIQNLVHCMFESGRVSIDYCQVCQLITKVTRELITRVRKKHPNDTITERGNTA